MTRRAFLILVGALGAGAVVAVAFLLRAIRKFPAPRAQETELESAMAPPERRILEHFSYLRLEGDAVRRFLRDNDHQHGSTAASDEFYHRFLLSTDFFQNGADEGRTIHYAAFFDPYATPCYNPLVSPAPPEREGSLRPPRST